MIFDWGGTLTPWHTVDHKVLWREVCRPHFPAAEAGDVARAIYAAERAVWEAIERSQESATLAHVFDRARVTATDSVLASYFEAWEPHTLTDPQAPPLLRELRRRKIRIGVLDSTPILMFRRRSSRSRGGACGSVSVCGSHASK